MADFGRARPHPPKPRCCRDTQRPAYSRFPYRYWNVQSTRKSPRFFDASSRSPLQSQQFSEPLPWTRQRARDQAQRAEPAIRRQRGVEIVFKIFACQIADGANAIKRQTQILRCARRPRRFHFYYRCAGRPQVAFFRRSLRDALNRYHGAGPEGFCCPWNQRLIRHVRHRGPALRQRCRPHAATHRALRRTRYCTQPRAWARREPRRTPGPLPRRSRWPSLRAPFDRPVRAHMTGSETVRTSCQCDTRPAHSRGSAATNSSMFINANL